MRYVKAAGVMLVCIVLVGLSSCRNSKQAS